MTEKDAKHSIDELLFNCAKSGDLRKAKQLIDQGANVNFGGREESTLHCAVIKNQKAIVELLLKNGANPSPKDSIDSTPLDYAIKNDNFEMADLLHENGAAISFPTFAQNVMTHMKSKEVSKFSNQNFQLSKRIVKVMEYGVSSKWTHGTPFHEIASLGDCEDLLLKMIQKGVDVDMLDRMERTPLLNAVEFNQIANVRVLLENGANPNISKFYEGSPFHVAIKEKHNEMALLMMKYGADVNLPCPDLFDQDNHPLHLAISNRNVEMAEALINHGCDVECKGSNGLTPMHHAAKQGFEDIIVALMKTDNANINVQLSNASLETPLHLATVAYERDCVKTLLEHGSCDYLKDSLGFTPFEMALRSNIDYADEDTFKTFLYHNHQK